MSSFFNDFLKLAKEKNIIKTSSNKVSLKPTGDFGQDILKLAYALKKIKKIEEAEELEKAYILYSAAESEIYNLSKENAGEKFLDDAHPEGSVEIVEDHEMHATNEAHEKILNIINSIK